MGARRGAARDAARANPSAVARARVVVVDGIDRRATDTDTDDIAMVTACARACVAARESTRAGV